MAAVVTSFTILRNGQTVRVQRYRQTSSANAALQMQVNPGVPFKLLWGLCKMSDDGVDTVTVGLNAEAGVGYDADFSTFVADTLYNPGGDLVFSGGDVIKFDVGAGGAGVTANMQAYIEILEAS